MYIQKANARNLFCFKASSITALLRWSHFLPPQQVIPLKYKSFLVSVFFLQDLTKRVDGANVQCIAKFTNFNEGAYKALVYLDRQNVACPKDYFLASFRLNRQNNRQSSKIRYSYQCCKFVL